MAAGELQFSALFTQNIERKRYRIVQLPDSFLTDNEHLWIKESAASGSAVLCTQSESFLMKSVETSNSLLLCDEQNVLHSSLDSFYELTSVKPVLSSLKALLLGAGKAGVDRKTIFAQVAASEQEIDRALKEFEAIENVDNRFYLIPFDDKIDLLKMCLSEYYLVDRDECDETVVRSRLLTAMSRVCDDQNECEKLLNYYLDRKSGELNVERISLLVARLLLARQAVWREEMFLVEWRAMLSTEMTEHSLPTIDKLIGLAIVYDAKDWEERGEQRILVAFDREQLSLDPAVRIKQLFSKRTQWPLNQFEVYLQDICTSAEVLTWIQRKCRAVDGGRKLIFKK